ANASVADVDKGRVIYFVSFSYQTNLSLTEFMTRQDIVYPTEIARMWDTNRISYPATLSTPTEGIMQQLQISLGNIGLSDADWKAFNLESNDKGQSITTFKSFVNTNYAGSNLFQQAPFTASRRFVHTVTWQVNDPLVHYMSDDIRGTTNEV